MDKGIWKSLMALGAPTGLNGSDKPHLGPRAVCPITPFLVPHDLIPFSQVTQGFGLLWGLLLYLSWFWLG